VCVFFSMIGYGKFGWRERAGEIESLLERVLERGGEGAGGNSLGMLRER
jgi:hypothetical protein